ncbi:hypothetical protein AHF37_01832 [Paragonimus kellicotti]|nr:hypothetical protein AHF37_01832 [Paragonimus kellicotti]
MAKTCAVECLHSELDRVCSNVAATEYVGKFKTDLILFCGDIQSLRNSNDLAGMSVPANYHALCDFWRYYVEERWVPIPTLFIGRNHEARGYSQDLPYGSLPLEIVLTEDWPSCVYHYGDTQALLRCTRNFTDEVCSDAVDSHTAEQLLCHSRSLYWFLIHLHCKVAAALQHSESPSGQSQSPRFLALDKCILDAEQLGMPKPHNFGNSLIPDIHGNSGEDDSSIASCPFHSDPRSSALEDPNVADAGANSLEESRMIYIDSEWLSILRWTTHLMSTSKDPLGADVLRTLAWQATVMWLKVLCNPQMKLLCVMLDFGNPNALNLGNESYNPVQLSSQLEEKIAEDDDDDEVKDEHCSVDEKEYRNEPTVTNCAPDAQHIPDPDCKFVDP